MSALAATVLVVPASPAAAQASQNAGGEFTPVVPRRVLDTRTTGALRANQVVNRAVAGVPGSGIPGSGVLAVAMNVTVVSPNARGFLTVWPTGQAKPPTSTLNYGVGQNVPNMVVSGVGPGGQVSLAINAGLAHVLIDVVGYYATSAGGLPRGARLVTTTPRRILDTRNGQGTGRVAPIGARGSIRLQVRGVAPVPNSGAITGVVLNVTAISPTAGTFLTVYPDDTGRPITSNINVGRGQIRPNLVMVKLGASGGIRIYNQSGAVHVAADVVGYYQTGFDVATAVGRVVPLTAPFRSFDTREYATRLGPRQREAWNYQPFVNSLTSAGTAVGPVGGLILNVTSTGVSANTFLTLFPDDAARPVASTLNPMAGQDVANLALVKLSRGARSNHIAAYNQSGWLHYIGDVTAVVLADS
jgi:hypothetical protein